MASKLVQLQSKACQASKFVAKHGNSYYKQLLEQNKQIQEPASVEKCNELSKQLLYTRLASIPGRYETFWNEEQSESEIETTAMSLAEDSLS